MITINFYFAVSSFLVIVLGLVLGAWIMERGQKSKELFLDKKFIWFCSVCTYTYIITKEEAFSTCPRCGSYNKRQGVNPA